MKTRLGKLSALVLIGLATLLSACQGHRYTFPTVEQLSTVFEEWSPSPSASHDSQTTTANLSGPLAEQLERGRMLAVTECSDCHRQYWPVEYSVDEWPGIIVRMGRRASLDPEDVADLRVYFDHASRWAHGEGRPAPTPPGSTTSASRTAR